MGLSFNFWSTIGRLSCKKIRGDTWLHFVWEEIFDLDIQKGSLFYIRL